MLKYIISNFLNNGIESINNIIMYKMILKSFNITILSAYGNITSIPEIRRNI